MQRFLDSVTLKGVKVTTEGYLVADAFAVRTGIQRYAGYEVGKPELPFVDVYRPEAEVFSAAALQSFSHVPVTNNHPAVAVTADNWKDFAVGEASTEVLRDGSKMKIPLILKDKSAISDVQNGKRELSAGYTCELAFEDGETADGVKYQAVQRNIRANHIAVVDRGRAGADFRIGDSEPTNWGAAPITTDRESPMSNLKTILHDGISIQVTDQGEQAINKLQTKLTAADVIMVDLNQQVKDKDTEIGQLKIDLQTAKDSLPSGAALDKLVADRATLLTSAGKIAKDVKFEGMTDAEIRRAAVAKAFGEDIVKDASDDQVIGMFKAATRDGAKADPVNQQLQARDTALPTATGNGQKAYEQRISDGWKMK
ncbi:putative capsid protein [Aminobacter phage Erebus]|nr:putative capsid protein [Aminobacter phage Erebus]